MLGCHFCLPPPTPEHPPESPPAACVAPWCDCKLCSLWAGTARQSLCVEEKTPPPGGGVRVQGLKGRMWTWICAHPLSWTTAQGSPEAGSSHHPQSTPPELQMVSSPCLLILSTGVLTTLPGLCFDQWSKKRPQPCIVLSV